MTIPDKSLVNYHLTFVIYHLKTCGCSGLEYLRIPKVLNDK
jgi:hypothetical protein